jgi:membrane protein
MDVASIYGAVKDRVSFLVELVSRSGERFGKLDGTSHSAALSYYSILSFFPLLLLIVTLLGFLIGRDASTRDRALASIAITDDALRAFVDRTLSSMQQSRAHETSAIVGIISLVSGASAAFGELSLTLNRIWDVKPRATKGIWGAGKDFVREQLAGFASVAALVVCMSASLVATTLLGRVEREAHESWIPALLQPAERVTSFAFLSLALASAFHFVPRSRPPLRTVLVGAVLTTAMLSVLKALFGLYVDHFADFSAYGIAGGFLALATWIFCSSATIVFGATLTRVRCQMLGVRGASETGPIIEKPLGGAASRPPW